MSLGRLKINAGIIVSASVSFVTFLAYLPSLSNRFLRWDDYDYIVGNPHLLNLNPEFFRWAFLDFYAANWFPITWISHALDYAMWGPDPAGHHLTNNILHAANTFFVVLLVLRLIEVGASRGIRLSGEVPAAPARLNKGGEPPDSIKPSGPAVIAATTGLLFGLHPLHVESVAWVAERKDLLCALFFLLSIMSYTKHAERKEQGAESKQTRKNISVRLAPGPMLSLNAPLLYALGFFCLALLSKPMAVSLPAVLLIIDWYPGGRINSIKTAWTAVVDKIPFIALSAASSFITILAQKSGGSIASMDSAPLTTRAMVAAKSLIAYLWKMLVPVDLLPFYPYPKSPDLFSAGYFLSILIVICMTAGCVFLMKRRKNFLAAIWAYYVVTLLPVLGLVQVGSQSMADRYSYLPSLGPFLIAGLLAGWLATTLGRKSGLFLRTAFAAGALVFLVLGYMTFSQIKIWKDDFTLWDYAIAAEPNGSALAYYNRCKLHEEVGRLEEAISDCDKAVRLDPSSAEAYNVRGSVLDKAGRPDKAISDYDIAIALDPSLYRARYNRGIALRKAGRLEEAISEYNRTLELNPSYYEAYVNRGNIFNIVGRADQAEKDYDRAIALEPSRPEAYSNRAFLFLNAGKRERAASDFLSACNSGDTKACGTLNRLIQAGGTTAVR